MASFAERERGSSNVTWGQTVANAGMVGGTIVAGVAVGGMLDIPVLEEIYDASVKGMENLTGFGSTPDTPQNFVEVVGNRFGQDIHYSLAERTLDSAETIRKWSNPSERASEYIFDNIKNMIDTANNAKIAEAIAADLGIPTEFTSNDFNITKEVIETNREALINFAAKLKANNLSPEQIESITSQMKRAYESALSELSLSDEHKAMFQEQIDNFDFKQFGQDIINSPANKVKDNLLKGELGNLFKGTIGSAITNYAMPAAGLAAAGLGYAHLNKNPLRQQGQNYDAVDNAMLATSDMDFRTQEQMRAVNSLMQARMATFGQGQAPTGPAMG